jgi:hypothetical protein
MEETLNKFMEMTISHQQEQHQHHPSNVAHKKNTVAIIKNIENLLSQITKQRAHMQGSRNPSPHTQQNSTEHENFIRIDEKIGVVEKFAEKNVVENKEGHEECGTMKILKITKPHVTQLHFSWPLSI